MRLKAAALAAIATTLALAPAALARSRAQEPPVPVVDVVEISGVIDTPTSNYLAAEIAAANRRGAELLVVQTSSPGGLNIRTESLLRVIDASRTPVAVYVGPQRAKAAGSAALLVAAAHIAAIGPSGRLGPAHPTNLAVDPSSSRGRALRTATRAQIDSFATARGRAAGAYLDTSIGAAQALEERQVDYRAIGVADLLKQANGRRVQTSAGERTLRLESDAVDVRFHKPGPWTRFLHGLVNTSLIYVLLVAGVLLVVFEIFQPGFGVAGVTGALVLAVAAYGLFVLPVALWAVLVFVAGCVLMATDIALDGLGPPTAVGLAGFIAGSFGMFPGPAEELTIAWWLALVGSLAALVFFVPVMTMVRRAHQPVRTRPDAALVGLAGQVRSMLNPEGYVWVAEALWRARAGEGERIRVGEDVLVTAIDGAVLRVRRA